MEVAHGLNDRNSRMYLFILFVSGVLFFIPFLGRVHLFDWDEINFAESAREMIVTGNYSRVQINFQPFWEKPPLFFWLQAASMKMFGINEFAARFPNAIFGIVTLITLFILGRKYKSRQFGFLWSVSYLGTFLPHLYFKSAIIDPVFNYFIFMGIYFMFRYVSEPGRSQKILYPMLSGGLIGLATLTKGPVGLLVFLLAFFVYFLFKKFKNFPRVKPILAFTLVFTAVSFLWFGMEVIRNGFWFLKEFLYYHVDLFMNPVASHGEPFYYHFVVVLIGCFPISIIAFPAFFSTINPVKKSFNLLIKILFWTVMILFSLTTTKIVHYSSLTYIPLAFLATLYIDKLIERHRKINVALLLMLGFFGLIFSFLLAAVPYIGSHPDLLIPYLHDPFAVASLNVPVNWTGYESLIGVAYFIAVMVSLAWLYRKMNVKGFLLLFYSTAVCLFFYLVTVVPKIEQFSQGPAINFYKSLAGKNVYVWPVGFKSYAQYFYAQKPPYPVYGEAEQKFLLTGNIDRPAFFVIKNTREGFDQDCNNCNLIREEGGFKFYRRDPTPP